MYLELSEEDQQLIDRIKKRVYRDPERATTMAEKHDYLSDFYPPATPIQIGFAEHSLGFPLPALIREIYLQVGNGGFGPGYGIVSVESGFTIYDKTLVELNLSNRQDIEFVREEIDPDYDWKRTDLMYAYWGCNWTTVVSCAYIHLPVYSLNSTDWKFHSSVTLRQWWQDWLDDKIQQT